MSKPKIVKDYDKLDKTVQELLKLNFPQGFDKKLIAFKNHKNKLISALPFETEENAYLIRMTREEARDIVLADADFDENGQLKSGVLAKLTKKHIG